MKPTAVDDKRCDPPGCWEELQPFVRSAAGAGTPVPEVERGLWRRLLPVGSPRPGPCFAWVGDGDHGDPVTLAAGPGVRRLPPHPRRPSQAVLGPFELDRGVSGSRESQQIEFVPLDARLGVPAGKFSSLLPDGDQSLGGEKPYQPVNPVLSPSLGVEPAVASREPMSHPLATTVDDFRARQPPGPGAAAAQLLVLRGDGTGGPLRQPATAPPRRAPEHPRGPNPDRQRRAVVGAVSQIAPDPRTPHEGVNALFHDPAATAPVRATGPRPTPPYKRRRARLNWPAGPPPGRAAAALGPGRVAEAPQRAPPPPGPWVVIRAGPPSRWAEVNQVLGHPPRTERLDLLQATGSRWEAVPLFHPAGSTRARPVMNLRVLGLLSGVGAALIPWRMTQAEASGLTAPHRERGEHMSQSFHPNRARLHSEQSRAAGDPIAAGVSEGAGRPVIQERRERTGMPGTVRGAQALRQWRGVALNGDWEAFMKPSIAPESRRL